MSSCRNNVVVVTPSVVHSRWFCWADKQHHKQTCIHSRIESCITPHGSRHISLSMNRDTHSRDVVQTFTPDTQRLSTTTTTQSVHIRMTTQISVTTICVDHYLASPNRDRRQSYVFIWRCRVCNGSPVCGRIHEYTNCQIKNGNYGTSRAHKRQVATNLRHKLATVLGRFKVPSTVTVGEAYRQTTEQRSGTGSNVTCPSFDGSTLRRTYVEYTCVQMR